jgi:hypothetical protein
MAFLPMRSEAGDVEGVLVHAVDVTSARRSIPA